VVNSTTHVRTGMSEEKRCDAERIRSFAELQATEPARLAYLHSLEVDQMHGRAEAASREANLLPDAAFQLTSRGSLKEARIMRERAASALREARFMRAHVAAASRSNLEAMEQPRIVARTAEEATAGDESLPPEREQIAKEKARRSIESMRGMMDQCPKIEDMYGKEYPIVRAFVSTATAPATSNE